MAYNNGFPVTYPQYYPQAQQVPQQMPQQMPQQAPSPQSYNMIWVQGEAGAKSYLVAPNTTVQLWDSEAPVIYLKSADASGMPSMKIIDYTIRGSVNTAQNGPLKEKVEEYVTKVEMDEFRAEISQKIEDIKESMGA